MTQDDAPQEGDNPENAQPETSETAQPETVTAATLELEQLRIEVAECKDKYTRLLAESENARKRMQKERQEMVQYAIRNTIVDFLNPIDHMEGALNYTQQMSEEVKQWAVGFQMILGQFKDILADNGVKPFTSVGQEFDPHSHEAIEMESTTDYLPGTVVSETLKGYKMGDNVIRPARVKVAKAPTEPKPPVNEQAPAEETNQLT